MEPNIEAKYAVEKSEVAPKETAERSAEAEQQEVAFDLLRNEILVLEKRIRALVPKVSHGDISEVRANLTLSFRHLEDARLRLGKAIQYSGDGVSCYDK